MLPAMAGSPDDQALMLRYRDGDVAAFEALYARHRGPLFRYFRRQGLGPEQAADLFHEVWLRVIRARERYRPEAKFTTYLYTLAHNCCVDEQRRPGRQANPGPALDPDAVPADPRGNPEDRAQAAQSVEQFAEALAALPAEQREAFLLREEAGLSLAEIATATGVTAETAKSRLRYAVGKLRRALVAPDD